MVQLNFNANNHEPKNGENEAIPGGEYQACIVATTMKENKKKNGQYLEIESEIIDGQFKGRRIWDRLNIDNPNETAVEIAKGRLSAICHAVGVMEMTDTAQLQDRPLVIKVKKIKRQDNDAWSNEVSAYFSMADKSAALQGTAATAAPWSHGGDAPF
ncbi:MAG: DUF669 domain-containing protein [Planctomycetes bacterium]|nr:DUF669 domain-containing protein [Planctomycetota bacterium]